MSIEPLPPSSASPAAQAPLAAPQPQSPAARAVSPQANVAEQELEALAALPQDNGMKRLATVGGIMLVLVVVVLIVLWLGSSGAL